MSVEPRLAAILAANVVGYSKLTGADDETTLEIFMPCRSEIRGQATAGS
ncbi:MAG: hypothetical protein QGG19_03055 [Alphaproteobacteria bacterium]|nr:hypothetical protein [Alphaproteobacteria bacterium]MDP6256050.1 hypothetical protein [Alphaproteobacteria bacterium]MDP7054277.1 hypothetical protein [Alphaproteobacteria bacterium]MDP7230575.1 hypothetical protein [Alphaproteobacteria bacterium]MDP7459408.1 hypothetical protein [Alphaproteobacteria bacterium]